MLVIRLLRSLTPSGPPSLRSDVLSATPQVNHSDTSPDFLLQLTYILLYFLIHGARERARYSTASQSHPFGAAVATLRRSFGCASSQPLGHLSRFLTSANLYTSVFPHTRSPRACSLFDCFAVSPLRGRRRYAPTFFRLRLKSTTRTPLQIFCIQAVLTRISERARVNQKPWSFKPHHVRSWQ